MQSTDCVKRKLVYACKSLDASEVKCFVEMVIRYPLLLHAYALRIIQRLLMQSTYSWRTMPILLIRVNTNALRVFPLRTVSHLRASQCYATLCNRNIRARRIVYLSLHRK